MTPTITTIVEDEYGNVLQIIQDGESDLWYDDLFWEESNNPDGDGFIWSI